jgi:hypothetical protein
MVDNLKIHFGECNVTWNVQYRIWQGPYRHQHVNGHYQDRMQNRLELQD